MFNGRQLRARGGVLTGGTETGTVHDSSDFLTSLLDTLWCPVLCVLSSTCDVNQFKDGAEAAFLQTQASITQFNSMNFKLARMQRQRSTSP